jgi:hypothetical protein
LSYLFEIRKPSKTRKGFYEYSIQKWVWNTFENSLGWKAICLFAKLLPLCLSQRFANRFKKILPHLGGNAFLFLLSVNCWESFWKKSKRSSEVRSLSRLKNLATFVFSTHALWAERRGSFATKRPRFFRIQV